MFFDLKERYLPSEFLNKISDNYTPRSIIFGIDFILIFFSALLSYALYTSILGKSPFSLYYFLAEILVITFSQAIFFLIFKTYVGIVRYSTLRDVISIVNAVVIEMVFLFLFKWGVTPFIGGFILNVPHVILYGMLSFSFLSLFRLSVKGLYEFLRPRQKGKRALILGVHHDDVVSASGLIDKRAKDFNIMGFIDNGNKPLKQNKILKLPLYSLKEVLNRPELADIIIVREEKIKTPHVAEELRLEKLLECGFKIFKLPVLEPWVTLTDHKFSQLKEIDIEDLLSRDSIHLDLEKLSSIYQDRVVLVTGAAGSIGSEIVNQLVSYNPRLLILVDQAETPLHRLSLRLRHQYPKLNYIPLIANVRNRGRMTGIFKEHNPEIVFHAAAYKHVPLMESNEMEAFSVNFGGTKNLADLATDFGVKRFVFVSTDKAVNPTNIMGASKRTAELYIQFLARYKQSETTFITTRFGNILGSNGSVVPYFKQQIAAGGPVTITHPDIVRYFMTISEACQLVLQAGSMGEGGEIFVFDMGKPVKILDLAKQMIRLSGLIPDEDIEIKFIGLRPGEKLYEELLADEENTEKTTHDKILIGQSFNRFNEKAFRTYLEGLVLGIEKNEHKMVLDYMKKLVPEYHVEVIEKPPFDFHA